MADRSRRFTLGAILFSLLLWATAGLAGAATITVSSTADSGPNTLRAAILAHASGDMIDFSVTGTITLMTTLPTITDTLTIMGPTGTPGITISGGDTVQLMQVNTGAVLSLQFLTFSDGSVTGASGSTGAGGAIYNSGALTLTNCIFSSNHATGGASSSGSGGFGFGGAIFNGGALTITNSTFSGNEATGGASSSSGNDAGGGGGGAIYNGGPLIISKSTFSANVATGGDGSAGADGNDGQGGAINSYKAAVTITNSTFSANQAVGGTPGGEGDGGAIWNTGPGVFTITNTTFSGNLATGGTPAGGGIYNSGGTVKLKSTILATSDPDSCGGTAFTDVGYNIADDDSCPTSSGTSVNDSTRLHLDPAGLENNGGPTKTIALEDNSQAVDFIPVADCTDQSTPTPLPVTMDQRGFPRPDPGNPNFCDVGAYELQTMPFAVSNAELQIARNPTTADSDEINLALTFVENGFPTCDAGTDAFNGFFVEFQSGTCATMGGSLLLFQLDSWVVRTIGDEAYGTEFFSAPPAESISARMVELPTPAAPACGKWSLSLEIAGVDSTPLGDGPFRLVLFNGDGGQQCFDITDAIVGDQLPSPGRLVRRDVRR